MEYIQKHELLTFKGNINMIISHKCWLTSGEKKEKMVCTADKNGVLKARLKTKIGKFCPKSVSLANPLRWRTAPRKQIRWVSWHGCSVERPRNCFNWPTRLRCPTSKLIDISAQLKRPAISYFLFRHFKAQNYPYISKRKVWLNSNQKYNPAHVESFLTL